MVVDALRDACERPVSSTVTDNDARRIEDKVDGVALAVARLEGALTPTLDKINDRQTDTETRLDELEERTGTSLADHEGRLRGLERFRYSVPSLAVFSFLASLGMLIYYVTSR